MYIGDTDYAALKNENAKLKRELNEARYSSNKYKTLFDITADAVSIIDLSTGKFIECNQSAIDLHGVLSEDNFLNLTPADISPEFQPCGKSSKGLAVEYLQKTVNEGRQTFSWLHTKLDGSTFQCLVSLTAIPTDKGHLIIAIAQDLSGLIETKEELKSAISHAENYEQAYLNEKEKFESFVNLAPVGIAINSMTDGSFNYINKEFSRFTGYSIDELNKMDYWQLTPEKYAEEELKQLKDMTEKGSYGPYYKEYIHQKGHNYPVLLSGIKITDADGNDAIWSVVQDITQQKVVEKQIQEAKEQADSIALRMQLANDSAGIGVWEWDITTNELVWDDWMYRLYGTSKKQFSGAYEAWESSVHQDDIKRAQIELESAVKGTGDYNPEFRVVRPDGNIRTMKASAEVIRDPSGKVIKVIGVNYDITDKISAIKKLEQAKFEAEQSSQAKSSFLANMSHEIRTPMNAILGGLQLLKGANLDSELRTILDNAAFSANGLLTVINDILDYSKIEANNLELEEIPFSMSEIYESITYDLDAIVSNKNISFSVQVESAFVDGWLGDPVRIKQILLNLASNAVKFTNQGAVTLAVATKQYKDNEAVFISIIDSGIGMTEEASQKIFERFTQADSSTTRKYGGTGLGMSITANLIEMMSGEIKLTSTVGKGTIAQVILPLKRAELKSTKEINEVFSVPDMKGKRILIAEDNKINQAIIRAMLRKTGAELTIVENGKLAVEAIEKEAFNLVFMDIQMPEMDGNEAQLKIKAIDESIPVIALTANVMSSDVSRYLDQGFVAHIAKPVDINILYSRLHEHSLMLNA